MSIVASFVLLAAGAGLPPGAPVRYEVAFPNVVHHEAEITVTFTEVPDGPLELRMSRSSPGRYALHEFGKNVYRVRADDGAGRSLPIMRPSPYQWDVTGHEGTVRVTYTLFADRADGTYAQIDETHAHLNMPAAFMWARGLDDRPIEVAFRPPPGSGWKAATQLFPTDDPFRFTAPGLQYLMDSPTELSNFSLREWTVAVDGRTSTMRLAVHHNGTEAEVDTFAAWAQRVVAQEIAVYGEPPAFDGGTYTFIADYLPYASGDGMEHRNSTILSSTSSLARNALGLLRTVSHEFFHAWNVERIRPRGLQPFDFERANMSDALWFAEGFTSYYTPLFLRRAGLTSVAQYARSMSGGLNAVINGPGRGYFSAAEMSMQAPFVDAATAIDPNNRINTFISYYTWGSAIGLNLDLTLRTAHASSLDAFMRFAWERFGRPETPYTLAQLEAALADHTGDAAFARDFFARYVLGTEVPDYASLLAAAGLLLRPANPGAAWWGDPSLTFDDGGATLTLGTVVGTPLYAAGLDRGDVIHAVDGRPVRSRADVSAALGTHRPGDTVTVDYTSRAGRKSTSLVLSENPRVEVVPFEDAGRSLDAAMTRFRAAWLESRER